MQRCRSKLHYTHKRPYQLNNYELVKLCLQGDAMGQKLLYERFVTTMARTCARYLKENTEAEDALIEGFMKVFNGLKKFEHRDEKSLEVWIRKIMINECLSRLRKKRMFMTVETETWEETIQAETTDLEAEDIFTLVRQLSEGYRTVFNLFAIDGYNHKEISELLGISETTSRSQLAHARNRLRELLNAHGWK